MNRSFELTQQQIADFEEQGFLTVDGLLCAEEVARYVQLYDQFLSGNIATGHFRHDLGGHAKREEEDGEGELITVAQRPHLHSARRPPARVYP